MQVLHSETQDNPFYNSFFLAFVVMIHLIMTLLNAVSYTRFNIFMRLYYKEVSQLFIFFTTFKPPRILNFILAGIHRLRSQLMISWRAQFQTSFQNSPI